MMQLLLFNFFLFTENQTTNLVNALRAARTGKREQPFSSLHFCGLKLAKWYLQALDHFHVSLICTVVNIDTSVSLQKLFIMWVVHTNETNMHIFYQFVSRIFVYTDEVSILTGSTLTRHHCTHIIIRETNLKLIYTNTHVWHTHTPACTHTENMSPQLTLWIKASTTTGPNFGMNSTGTQKIAKRPCRSVNWWHHPRVQRFVRRTLSHGGGGIAKPWWLLFSFLLLPLPLPLELASQFWFRRERRKPRLTRGWRFEWGSSMCPGKWRR